MQILLRTRYLSDLVNSHDHRLFLDQTTLGTRFKTNNIDAINPSILLFHRYGISLDANSKTELYAASKTNSNILVFNSTDINEYNLVKWFDSVLNLVKFKP